MISTLRAFLILALFAIFALTAPQAAFAQNGVAEELGKLFDDLVRKGEQRELTPSAPVGMDAPDKRIPFGRQDMELSFAPLVKATSPAVVNVYAARTNRQRSTFEGDPFFEQFFGREFRGPPRIQSSLGSGVIVDPSGIIVTNNHVIANADEVKIALPDGREFECKILLKDERVDLAVLKIETSEVLPVLEFENSDALEVGDLVLAMGNPFGVGQTTTSGIISALARNQVGISDFGFFIQTDAAINPGNSGGALINMSGKLIGINTAIFSRGGGSIGIGFAIPSNMVKVIVDTAKGGGDRLERPYIGATFQPVSSDVADSLGMRRPYGALVTAVVRGGPSEAAGLRAGDVILSMDGVAVEHPDALGYRLSTTGMGKTARFEVLSRGQTRIVAIKLQRAPQNLASAEQAIEGRSPLSGLTVTEVTPELAERLGMPQEAAGIIVKDVYRGSPAQRLGFRPGDILLEINGDAIVSVDDVIAAAESEPALWRFKINRGGQIIRQLFR
ncbi:MAG: DegQ family serine endoprotease [Rhizobiaceae bacterium]